MNKRSSIVLEILGFAVMVSIVAYTSLSLSYRSGESQVTSRGRQLGSDRLLLPALDLSGFFGDSVTHRAQGESSSGANKAPVLVDLDQKIQAIADTLNIKELSPSDQLTSEQRRDLAKVLVTFEMNERTVLAAIPDDEEIERLLGGLREDTRMQLRVRTTERQWAMLEKDPALSRLAGPKLGESTP